MQLLWHIDPLTLLYAQQPRNLAFSLDNVSAMPEIGREIGVVYASLFFYMISGGPPSQRLFPASPGAEETLPNITFLLKPEATSSSLLGLPCTYRVKEQVFVLSVKAHMSGGGPHEVDRGSCMVMKAVAHTHFSEGLSCDRGPN